MTAEICFITAVYGNYEASTKKFVKQNILSAAMGMWLAIIVLAPIGAFLTYKAMHDSQLFNKDFYNKLSRKIKSIFSKKLQKVSYE